MHPGAPSELASCCPDRARPGAQIPRRRVVRWRGGPRTPASPWWPEPTSGTIDNMRHLNYNHLLYFWTVAREGSIARAVGGAASDAPDHQRAVQAARTELSANRCFIGWDVVWSCPTPVIWSNSMPTKYSRWAPNCPARARQTDWRARRALNVGIVNSIPKLIAYRILRPALELAEPGAHRVPGGRSGKAAGGSRGTSSGSAAVGSRRYRQALTSRPTTICSARAECRFSPENRSPRQYRATSPARWMERRCCCRSNTNAVRQGPG